MINSLYIGMGLPASCYLGKRVFKKHFYENADLSTADKIVLSEDVESITWQYTLKPETIPIPPYADEQREYLEVAVLQVDLTSAKRMGRLAEIIHRAIPYPLVLVFVDHNRCSISLAPKRFSQADRGALVVEEFLSSGWISLGEVAPVEEEFLASLSIDSLPFTHFYAFYLGLVERVLALEGARLCGMFRLELSEQGSAARKAVLDSCRRLETDIAQCRAAIKKEKQFNRQVELNVKLKQLDARLKHLIKSL